MEIVITLVVLIVIALIVGFFIVGLYNSLVGARVQTEEAWSGVTVQLKRRADLLPNLIATVKGYATHESSVFERVTQARANTINQADSGPAAVGRAEGEMHGALKSLFAVAEDYPVLQASANFLQLQADLTDTEDKIMASRRFYNGSVRDYNTKTQQFPSNIVAKSFSFKSAEFFEVEDLPALQVPPAVSF
jgi:LemA protein